MRRIVPLALVALALTAAAPRARGDGNGPPDPHGGIFFRDPDKDTAARIADAIAHMATGSVLDRAKARHELEAIGWWSVEPLIAALARAEPPIRSASVLGLDALRDRRAVEPLRAAVVRETTDRYVAAFAALSLGRFRDAAALEAFAGAVKTTKTMDLLKAAIPLAAAKIRSPEARDLVLERVRAPGQKEPIRSAGLLALGFFPAQALAPDGTEPSADLAAGLESGRRGERQAAVLAYVVAASGRGDIRTRLRTILAKDTAAEVSIAAMLGLARVPDADVTALFAEVVARHGEDRVREFAADLLADRLDAASAPAILATATNAPSARLRAACVIALARLEDDAAAKLVAQKFGDRSPLVRAACAVGLSRRATAAGRAAALAILEPRAKRGDTNDDVKADFEKARALLAGERTDVRFVEIGGETLFSELPLTVTQRLLRAVNQRLMSSLDLDKIQNLQTDTELVPNGPPALPGANGEAPSGDEGAEGGGDAPAPAPPDGNPMEQPGSGTAVGAARTSNYQELRDLKIELLRSPYFTEADLPAPPTTPGPPK